MIASSQPHLTVEEYLAWETQQDIRHEYVNGAIVAMTGGSIAHNLLALNLYSALRPHLQKRGCVATVSDVKVQVSSSIYYYPDLAVTCSDRDLQTRQLLQDPCLIVEVVSDETEASDRGDKFHNYQMLESLQEYVLISPKRQRLDCFRRTPDGMWLFQVYSPIQQTFQLQSIDFEGAIADLYGDVTFE